MSNLCASVNKQSEDLDQLQQKVESLLQRMDAPLVDRMPNLALRSLGKSSSSSIGFNRIHTCALFSNVMSFICVQAGSQVFPELSSPTYWPVEDCGKWSGAFCSWFKPQSHHRVIQVGITHLQWNVIVCCNLWLNMEHYIFNVLPSGTFIIISWELLVLSRRPRVFSNVPVRASLHH